MSMQFPDCVELSAETAEWISSLDLVDDVYTVNAELEKMAWLAVLLRQVEDGPDRFPKGKWATIQAVEDQLDAAAKLRVKEWEEER